MSKKTSDIILILIIIIAGFLRLSWLNRLPAGFNPDEAAFGYNGYSLLLTGRDEWGIPGWELFTRNLRSFGDYKLPLYAFLTVPSVKIFGLNQTAVRLPNAVIGSLAVVSIFYLTDSLFKRKKLSLLTALLVAISPWSISLSRGAFEANLVTFFLPLAVYFYLHRNYIFSALFFAVNLYSYHSARIITPFVFLLLLVFYRPQFGKKLISALVVFVFLTLPAINSYLGVGRTRVSDVSMLNPTDNWSGVSDRRFQDGQAGLSDKYSRIFNNKLTVVVGDISRNYLSYFSPQFLFTLGAGEAAYGMIPGRGLFYWLELPFLLFALFKIARYPDRPLLLVLALALIGPIPATLTKGLGFSANRAAPMFPFLVILISYGITRFLDLIRRHLKTAVVLLAVAYLVLFSFFIEDYIYHAPRLNAPSMSFGWEEAISRFKPISVQYPQIKISRSFSEAQIFIAFYWPISPDVYQNASADWSDFDKKGFRFLDQYDGYRLGNIRFGDLNPNDPVSVPTLLVGKPEEFPAEYPYYFRIYYPTGFPAIQVSAKTP